IDKTFPTHIAVKDPDLKGRVKGFQVGDHVDLTVGSEALPVLHSIAPSLVSLSAQGRLSWLCAATVSFVLIYLLAWSIGRLIAKKPLRLLQPLIGQDGRYSNSTVQVALWFAILMIAYAATAAARAWHLGVDLIGVGINQNLLMLSGLSALTFAG